MTLHTASPLWRRILCAAALCAAAIPSAFPQALAWDQIGKYRYNILGMNYAASTRTLTVIYSVTNPTQPAAPPYNLLPPSVAPTFVSPASLRVIVAWNAGAWGSPQWVNTKDGPYLPVPRTIANSIVTGPAPASALSINALSAAAKRCSDAGSPCQLIANANVTFWVRTTLPAAASGALRIGIEGHPSIQTGTDPVTQQPVFASIPVTSAARDLVITNGATAPKQIVEFTKCKACHDDRKHGDTIVPRLSLHGANRNENPEVCVMCHNPDQTDAAYRTSGAEESVDFKRMVHGIHAGGFRTKPLIIIGRNGSVNDYSHVRFPSSLRNCVVCHIDNGTKGTFELPMSATLGSTINTASVLSPAPGQIDIDPANNLRISPIAATCTGCHDKSEDRRHMVRMGASFGVVQSVLAGKEMCVKCHGPGRSEDVRKAHEIRGSGSRDDD